MAQLASTHFLKHIVDYAGFFPPTQLPFEKAFANYVQYQKIETRWMLSNFICPLSKIDKLGTLINNHYSDLTNVPLVIVGSPMLDAHSLTETLKTIMSLKAPMIAKTFEFKLDTNYNSDIFKTDAPIPLFIEPNIQSEKWKSHIQNIVERINQNNLNHGIKLRCGGPRKEFVPNPNKLAFAINLCTQSNIPVKFTAGLHHALTHFNEKMGTINYGFLNMFFGYYINMYYDIHIKELESILIDTNVKSFKFSNNSFSYKDNLIDNKKIKKTRRDLLPGFGSCRFDIPCDELKNMEII